MANVQLSKCEKNVAFFINKIATLEKRIDALADAVGLERRSKEEEKTDGDSA